MTVRSRIKETQYEWHDATRKLPWEGGYYIVQYEDGAVRVRRFNAFNQAFRHPDDNNHGEVRFWIAFPVPPLPQAEP